MEMVCKLKGYYHIYSDTDYSDSFEEFFGIHRMSDKTGSMVMYTPVQQGNCFRINDIIDLKECFYSINIGKIIDL